MRSQTGEVKEILSKLLSKADKLMCDMKGERRKLDGDHKTMVRIESGRSRTKALNKRQQNACRQNRNIFVLAERVSNDPKLYRPRYKN